LVDNAKAHFFSAPTSLFYSALNKRIE